MLEFLNMSPMWLGYNNLTYVASIGAKLIGGKTRHIMALFFVEKSYPENQLRIT